MAKDNYSNIRQPPAGTQLFAVNFFKETEKSESEGIHTLVRMFVKRFLVIAGAVWYLDQPKPGAHALLGSCLS